ncbi:MAG: ABC transporter substrate-binding protein [Actinomycetota bacterium]|nr:ABC transporter substrate-binding protein [Actinomycetota bacterium]
MRKTAITAALLIAVAACSSSNAASSTTESQATTTTGIEVTTTTMAATTTTESSGFPVDVDADNGTITIDARPEAIISLSSTATEMLFAIGAGPQVIAVDDQSNYPTEAPMTDLSGFTPNLEAILSLAPDLVVITFDPGDLIAGLETAGVPVLSYGGAFTIDDVYRQIDALGVATGNSDRAADANDAIQHELADVVAGSVGSGEGVTYYHEIDSTLYTATSSTFFGEIYGLFGLVNVADPADAVGAAFGYPQLSAEFVVAADPDIIFLSNVLYGETAETVSERSGWGVMSAIQEGNIVELDSDVASRWGPRIVDFAQSIADALNAYQGG